MLWLLWVRRWYQAGRPHYCLLFLCWHWNCYCVPSGWFQITPNPNQLFDANLHPLLFKIHLDRALNLTWFGRCNIFKMTTLPQILYMNKTLPPLSLLCFFYYFSDLYRGKQTCIGISLSLNPHQAERGYWTTPCPTMLQSLKFSVSGELVYSSCNKSLVEIKQEHSPVPLSCISWLLSGRLTSLIMHQIIGATPKVVSSTFFLAEILPQPSHLISLLTDLKCLSIFKMSITVSHTTPVGLSYWYFVSVPHLPFLEDTIAWTGSLHDTIRLKTCMHTSYVPHLLSQLYELLVSPLQNTSHLHS